MSKTGVVPNGRSCFDFAGTGLSKMPRPGKTYVKLLAYWESFRYNRAWQLCGGTGRTRPPPAQPAETVKPKGRENMKKRFLAMLLALVMCLALVPTAALAADSDFVIEDGVLTVYNGKDVNVVIPDGITSIGRGAFKFRTQVVSVTIPNSVTSIETSAFLGCSNLTSVAIPDSVTSIGAWVFSFCTSLTSVTIPNSVTSIGNDAFNGCTGLTSVTIPNSVTSIGNDAFSGCTSLTSVTVSGSVTGIGEGAFSGCTGLTNITIPSGVTRIGRWAFYNCTSLTDVYYGGSETQWKVIGIGDENAPLISAKIHCNSTGPDQPTTPDKPTLPTVEQIPATGTAVARTQAVKLDGRDVEFQCYAVKNAAGDETNYVKVRDLAQALNGTKAQFNVDWDGRISITSDTPYVAVGGEGTTPYSGDQPYRLVSNTPVSFNGSSVNLTSFSISYQGGGYTYYKLRDLGQLLNFNVTWNGSSIIVESDKPYTG